MKNRSLTQTSEGQRVMESTALTTSQQKLEQLKKMSRRVSYADELESGRHRFEELGLDPEDVERMARLVDLEADDLYRAVSTKAIFLNANSVTAGLTTVESEIALSDRLHRLEEAVSRIGRNSLVAHQYRDDDVVTHLRRIADHFDPPNLEIVGTSYIAERIGVTTKWVGDLVRKKEIPSSCICPKSGGGNYWRFWKSKIDKWIEER